MNVAEGIDRIKNSSRNLLKVIKFVNMSLVFILLALLGGLIWASFLPQEAFHAERGGADWLLSLDISGKASFFASVSFNILQPLDPSMFQAKTAYITFFSTSIFIFFLVLLYGIKQVEKILLSITEHHTPFTNQNAMRLRKLAFIIIGYYLLGDLIVNIAMICFVTHIFHINLMNIGLSGLIIGALLLIISQIFRYGAYLQEEFDTTL